MMACWLPVKSPWLNLIEPKWVQGKRTSVEPAHKLAADEVYEHVPAHCGCERCAHLHQKKQA